MSKFKNKERPRQRLIGLTCLTVLACLALASSAGAKPKATVSWSFPRTASEGAAIPFSWTAKHLGRHYRLVVQRPFGTARVWRSIMRVRTTSGAATLPGLPLGVHRFRIAAFRGRRFLAQQTANIRVYGTVPFTTLFQDEYPDVYAMPSNSFSYVGSWSVYNDGSNLFGVRNNRCSSVHVAFATRATFEVDGVATLTVVQESRDPVSSSAPFNEVGSVDAELIPGQTWGVNASTTENKYGEYVTYYINGYAICSSTEPFSE